MTIKLIKIVAVALFLTFFALHFLKKDFDLDLIWVFSPLWILYCVEKVSESYR